MASATPSSTRVSKRSFPILLPLFFYLLLSLMTLTFIALDIAGIIVAPIFWGFFHCPTECHPHNPVFNDASCLTYNGILWEIGLKTTQKSRIRFICWGISAVWAISVYGFLYLEVILRSDLGPDLEDITIGELCYSVYFYTISAIQLLNVLFGLHMYAKRAQRIHRMQHLYGNVEFGSYEGLVRIEGALIEGSLNDKSVLFSSLHLKEPEKWVFRESSSAELEGGVPFYDQEGAVFCFKRGREVMDFTVDEKGASVENV